MEAAVAHIFCDATIACARFSPNGKWQCRTPLDEYGPVHTQRTMFRVPKVGLPPYVGGKFQFVFNIHRWQHILPSLIFIVGLNTFEPTRAQFSVKSQLWEMDREAINCKKGRLRFFVQLCSWDIGRKLTNSRDLSYFLKGLSCRIAMKAITLVIVYHALKFKTLHRFVSFHCAFFKPSF